MNCQHATLLIGANPYASSPELTEHLHSCPSCAKFQSEMVTLESNIKRALDTAPPQAAQAPAKAAVSDIKEARVASMTRRQARPALWRGWAIAASVALAVVAALWIVRPSNTLAHDLIVHVNGEPHSWDSTRRVDTRSLEAILSKAGVADFRIASPEVTYAQTCFFRGHFVPHLVVHTVGGPVTVIVLPDEHVSVRQSFYEEGYAGVIVPAQHGGIAVLARGTANIDDVAQRMQLTLRSAAPR